MMLSAASYLNRFNLVNGPSRTSCSTPTHCVLVRKRKHDLGGEQWHVILTNFVPAAGDLESHLDLYISQESC